MFELIASSTVLLVSVGNRLAGPLRPLRHVYRPRLAFAEALPNTRLKIVSTCFV